jgi:hypothetical protein
VIVGAIGAVSGGREPSALTPFFALSLIIRDHHPAIHYWRARSNWPNSRRQRSQAITIVPASKAVFEVAQRPPPVRGADPFTPAERPAQRLYEKGWKAQRYFRRPYLEANTIVNESLDAGKSGLSTPICWRGSDSE